MNLFSSYRLGPTELTNRVVMAPMTRSRAPSALPNALMREYYTQRASAGLIITEGIAPSPNALGYARIPGLFSPEQVDGWRAITRSVHEAGGRIFAQLMHVGRIAHPHNLPANARILAPSSVRPEGTMYTDQAGLQPYPSPEAMSEADLRATRDELVQAARNAIAAGFDGVEFHGANGYLLEQFLHPHTNRREDAYGGSAENRARFVVEVVRAVSEAIGAERVAIRLSPYSTYNDLPAHEGVQEQYTVLARELRGLVYVHLIASVEKGFTATADAIRRSFGGPIILNGGFTRDRAQAALDAGRADLIAFGRPFIANPDLVARMKGDAELAAPDFQRLYTPGAEGYVDYPALG
ncbi:MULTISPECIES: alkene reductase [unclassified Myxococcus]|uniref:alkene reductase n=1 Tax=unclassified Myxococcus TaxID=2648731 RepID=UPI00157AB261|nr:MULTISPECIES: alkene reductase [unclassified Myxococcus]NTX35960.1 alkene reductase [Myxococcus sp. CA033]NTX51112.1 alkene reductase [Myxococcus sp. CA039A]